MTEEMTEAPQWALDEAVKREGTYANYAVFLRYCPAGSLADSMVKAHALTIAKHETPPPDRDLEKARELVKDYQKSEDVVSGGMWILERDAEQAIAAGMKWARQEANND